MFIYYNISYFKLNSVECFRMNVFTFNGLNKCSSHPIVFPQFITRHLNDPEAVVTVMRRFMCLSL